MQVLGLGGLEVVNEKKNVFGNFFFCAIFFFRCTVGLGLGLKTRLTTHRRAIFDDAWEWSGSDCNEKRSLRKY